MKEKYDLTSGGILNKLLVIAIPIMGAQLLQMAYNLTDMFWLGRLSSDAVAASGSAGMYMWLANALLLIGRMGAEIGVSQNLGKKDTKSAYDYSKNALFLAVVLGVGFAALMIVFRVPLISFFKIQEQHVAAAARDYLAIVALGIPFQYISGSLNGTFNASGNSKLPFLINGVGLVINMILDPLFISVWKLEIRGAALATVLAQVVVCIMFLIAVKTSSGRPFISYRFREVLKPEKQKIKQIFRWSTPVALESLFFTVLSMIISRLVAAYGAGAIAVQKVGTQVESLSWMISGGFSSALTAFIGQNYGAGKWDRVNKGFRISAILMCIWGLMVTFCLWFAARGLMQIFLTEADLVDMGVQYLRILAFSQLAACMEGMASGAFRGKGKTLPPSVVSISCNMIRVPIAYLLSRTSLGLDGIWVGISLGAFLRGACLSLWYLLDTRRWKKITME